MLNRFENAISKRMRDVPPVAKAFPNVIENTRVPGPTSDPASAFPNRPMLLAGTENAVRLK
jgi:hypothetical protein